MLLLFIVLVGLCMGSFVEAASWRLHEQSVRKKLIAKQKKELSITRGRSMCPQCKHILAWYDLVPLLSWASVQGKCRYCRKSIGFQAPLLELTTATLFGLSYAYWPITLTDDFGAAWVVLGAWLAGIVLMVLLAVYDLRWMLLPNKLVWQLFVVSVVFIVSREVYLGFEAVVLWQIVGSVLISAGLFWVLYQVSGGRWIGGGDVKLAVPLGVLISEPVRAALMLFVASVLGSIVGMVLIARHGRGDKAKIPFGPFLIAATIIVVLFGDGIIDWYLAVALGA